MLATVGWIATDLGRLATATCGATKPWLRSYEDWSSTKSSKNTFNWQIFEIEDQQNQQQIHLELLEDWNFKAINKDTWFFLCFRMTLGEVTETPLTLVARTFCFRSPSAWRCLPGLHHRSAWCHGEVRIHATEPWARQSAGIVEPKVVIVFRFLSMCLFVASEGWTKTHQLVYLLLKLWWMITWTRNLWLFSI